MNEAGRGTGEEWIGRVIDGRYQIVARLGEGGMGAVFEAEQLALQRRVALKVIHGTFSGDGEVRARFAREAMASGQLDGHPHVATALDFGTLPDGSLYLVMQLVRGPSLRDVVEAGALPWERAVTLGAQVADALSAAHAAGIIHRDLKPDNVALVRREDGREVAKVLDFGIARVTGDAGTSSTEPKLTRIGTVMGTPGYMAPEQAVGDVVDARADLYSLGAMLYEMLVGSLPFDGPDLTSILAQQFSHTAPAPSVAARDASIPAELDDLVLALLARSAADRPASAADVHRSLVRLVRLSELPDDSTGSSRTADRTGSRQTNSPRVTLASTTAAAKTLATDTTVRAKGAIEKLHTQIAARLPRPYRPYSRPITYFTVGLPLFLLVVGVGTRLSRHDEVPEAAPVAVSPGALENAASAVRDLVVPPSGPSPEVLAAIETLGTSDNRQLRATAAEVIARGGDATPAFATRLAALETARGCAARKAAIAAVVSEGDVRARPYLGRLSRSPRRGCGFLNSRDCDACIREDVRQALATLGTP